MDCSKCAWPHPETCRACVAEQKEKEEANRNEAISQV